MKKHDQNIIIVDHLISICFKLQSHLCVSPYIATQVCEQLLRDFGFNVLRGRINFFNPDFKYYKWVMSDKALIISVQDHSTSQKKFI